MDADQYYSSSDLGLIAALTMDFPLERVDRTNSKKVVFFFKNCEALQKKVAAFTNNKLKVDAQTYYRAVHQIKNILYGRQPEGKTQG